MEHARGEGRKKGGGKKGKAKNSLQLNQEEHAKKNGPNCTVSLGTSQARSNL